MHWKIFKDREGLFKKVMMHGYEVIVSLDFLSVDSVQISVGI